MRLRSRLTSRSTAVASLLAIIAGASASAAGCRGSEPAAPSALEGGSLSAGYDPPLHAGHAGLATPNGSSDRALDAGLAYATADAGPAPPPYIVPPREPMPSVPMALKPGDPMKARPLPPGKRIGRGGVVPPGIPVPDRVAIATTDGKGSLVDARSGRALLALPAEPRYVSPRAGVVILEGKSPRLVRLYDNTLVLPAFGAGGRKLESTWLAATDAHPRAIAFAQTATGEKLAGLASDDVAKFELYPVPLDPAGTHYAATLNAIDWHVGASPPKGFGDAHGTPFSFPHDQGCVRAKVANDGTITCLEHLPRAGIVGVAWTADDWIVGETFVSHVSFGAKTIPFDDARASSMCMTRAHRATPPRAVVTCHKSSDAILWAPGKLLTFKGPTDPNDVGGLVGAEAGPVLPIIDAKASPHEDRSASSSTRWLDTVGLRILSSPKMRPLGIAAFAGMESVALAEERADKSTQSDVYVLDFEKATRELVAKIGDCPGPLAEIREDRARGRRRWLVLACLAPAPRGSYASNVIWTEIVDLEQRARWRTPLLPELFFPDGVVVLSTRRALAAESKTAPGELFSVDLASMVP